MDHSGPSINTYLDDYSSMEREHCLRWKKPEYNQAFKLATPKGSLDVSPMMILDIVLKIIIQDVGSRAKLSTWKYKPLMSLVDDMEVD